MNDQKVQIKICGLTRAEDCQALNVGKSDFAGFVFAPSRRQVTPDQARRLISMLDPQIAAVGVFVTETDDQIIQAANQSGIQIVQLHGAAIPGRISRLKQRLPLKFWQRLAIPLDQSPEEALQAAEKTIADFQAQNDPNDQPDAWLLDSCRPGQAGGTGIPFDWSVFIEFSQKYPVVLAGGLDAGNVVSAIQLLHPKIVDCSSGVETDGLKDPKKIDIFCRVIHDLNMKLNIPQPANPANGGADMTTNPDSRGRFGPFGGRYSAETLMPALLELEKAYNEARQDLAFLAEYHRLLRDYAGRPSRLYLAERISKELGFTILLKREDLNHTGAHKINNVLGQVLLARRMGKRRLIAETGAGQHGVAAATAAALFGMSCDVFMGAEDTARQALNVYRMELLGAKVHSVTSGTATLKDATSEAMREWSRRADDTFYVIGSTVGPHPYPMIVRDFQRVIGDEIRSQMMEKYNRLPTALFACVGGGSNAMGTFYPFLDDRSVRLIGAEAGGEGVDTDRHAATMAQGTSGVFHGMHSLFLQDDDGQIMPVYSISAGLDYPGIGPEHAYLQHIKRAEYHSITDREAVDAFAWLARMEGIIPAIESSHALALLRKMASSFRPDDVVVVTLSGRGDKDVAAIQAWQEQNGLNSLNIETQREADQHDSK